MFSDPLNWGKSLVFQGSLEFWKQSVHSKPRAENKVCHGGRRRTDFDQVQGVTLKH